jgi:hypothetical protein
LPNLLAFGWSFLTSPPPLSWPLEEQKKVRKNIVPFYSFVFISVISVISVLNITSPTFGFDRALHPTFGQPATAQTLAFGL